MLALFRNPLLRLLGRLWWLPALTIVAAWGLGGERGLRLAGLGVVAYLAAVAGIVGAASAHGAYAASRERARHRSAQHRFLCPDCLHFGDFDFACGACGKRVEAFLVHTSGAYVNDCPHCHEHLLSREGLDGRGVQAHCERCKGNCDRAIHHERQVRVLATLLKSVWLDAAGDDTEAALKVGEAADRFDRQTGLAKTLTVCMPQIKVSDAVKNVLETRFEATSYGSAKMKLIGTTKES